ncbi:MAG TPA: hypothetical protein VIK66_02560 [Gaiellaceae bacterium]|jgi:hypothetical protein
MSLVVILAVVCGSVVLLSALAIALDTVRLSPEDVARAHAIVAARTRERRA